jgi:two-component system response regulator FlrC
MNSLPEKKLADSAESALLGYHWPGNVRELENTLERAVLLSERVTIQPEDLFPGERHPTVEMACNEADDLSLKKMEKRMIHAALDRHGGNRTHAAKVLGISVRTLRNKLNEYKRGQGQQ